MSIYDYDEIIDRRNTNCLKYDFAVERGKPEDVLPLWVADMDFRTPPGVLAAMKKSLDHGIFGYTEAKEDYKEAVIEWFEKRFDVLYQKEWLVKTPGVVFALALSVKAFTEKGDTVLIQTPVYYPFYEVIRDNGRKVTENPLIHGEQKYSIDFEDFEKKIIDEKVKLFILCSPHNPVGRVWKPEELTEMLRICRKHGVIIVSDEIHCDFVFDEHTFTPVLREAGESLENIVICTSPGKTFNLAGLQDSNIFIPDSKLRSRFIGELNASGYSQLNHFAVIAGTAAYKTGEPWLEELLVYLKENLEYLKGFLKEQMPKAGLIEPEGTYLVWLDFSGYGYSKDELNDRIIHRAKLWLDAGEIFGREYELFQRLVIACPRKTLETALKRLAAALS